MTLFMTIFGMLDSKGVFCGRYIRILLPYQSQEVLTW